MTPQPTQAAEQIAQQHPPQPSRKHVGLGGISSIFHLHTQQKDQVDDDDGEGVAGLAGDGARI